MYLGQSGFWQGIPNSSENVATMQHSTPSSGPSGSSRLQILSSSLSGGSDLYSIPIASRLRAALLPSSLFPLSKLRRALPEGSGPALGKRTEGRYPFCVSRRYGGVGAEAGSDPRGHLGVTWAVYLCAGKPPLADVILSHPPDLTRGHSVIGLAIPAMSGHIQYRGAAS